MASKRFEEFQEIAHQYFEDNKNKPFSILEVCSKLGIEHKTLLQWENGKNIRLAQLAYSIKLKVAAGWEKGEVSPTLALFLLKNYLGINDEQPNKEFKITVEVIP